MGTWGGGGGEREGKDMGWQIFYWDTPIAVSYTFALEIKGKKKIIDTVQKRKENVQNNNNT